MEIREELLDELVGLSEPGRYSWGERSFKAFDEGDIGAVSAGRDDTSFGVVPK